MIDNQSTPDLCSTEIENSTHNSLKEEHMARWKTLLIAEHYNEAIQQIQQFIENSPTIQTTFAGIGNIQQNEGVCLGTEIKWFFKEIERNPLLNNPYDLLSLLSCYSEHTTELINWYNKLLEKIPDCYKIRFALGTALYNSYQHRKAQQHYKEVVKIRPNFVPAYIALCWIQIFCYFRFSKALKYANIALSLDPNNFHAKLIIAGFHPSFDKSMQILQEIKNKNSDNPLVLCAEAYRLAQKGDSKQKIFIILTKALSMNARTSVPYLYLAKGLKHNSQAKVYLQQAIALYPQDHRCYSELAYHYYLQDNNQLALEYFQKSLSVNPSHCFSLYISACIHKDLGNYEVAIEFYLKCIESNPYYQKAYPKIQQIYSRMDRQEEQYRSMLGELKVSLQMADEMGEDTLVFKIVNILKQNKDGNASKKVIQLIRDSAIAEKISVSVACKLLKKEMVGSCKQFIEFTKTISNNPLIYYCMAQIHILSQEWSSSLDQYLRYLELTSQDQMGRKFQYTIPQKVISILGSIKYEQVKEQVRIIQSYFLDHFGLCWAVGKYYESINWEDEAVKIYSQIIDRTMTSSQEYLGNPSRWNKLKHGTYSSHEKMKIHRDKLVFKTKFYEMFKRKEQQNNDHL